MAAFSVGALLGGAAGTLRCFVAPSPCIRTVKLQMTEKPKNSKCGTMSDEAPVCEIHRDENGNVFVLIDGMKIAERGLLGTPQADTWIMLKPGWMVRDVKGGKAIQVSYEHAWMH